MKPKKRDATYFASLSDKQVEEELLRLDIGERFDGDIECLTLIYADVQTREKWDKARQLVIKANPHRHSSIFTPLPGEPPIPRPEPMSEQK
jgi:hypothetical protein